MRVFLLPEAYTGSKIPVLLSGKSYRYLIKVLRLKVGDHIVGRATDGNLWDVELLEIEGQSVHAVLTEPEDPQEISKEHLPPQKQFFPDIRLYQALCKAKKMDQIIRQATEIGVSEIIPLVSHHIAQSTSDDQIPVRQKRWETIRSEALQQSGSPVMTKITMPVSVETLETMIKDGQYTYFFHQIPIISSDKQKHSQNSFFAALKNQNPLAVTNLLIGPEGGFSDGEIAEFLRLGYIPVFLKTNVLRAETAAIYALSVAQTVLVENYLLGNTY